MDEHDARQIAAVTTDWVSENWTPLDALVVEIQVKGRVVDRGVVDAVTSDGSILWLKQDGATQRRLIERTPGVILRVQGRDHHFTDDPEFDPDCLL